MTLDEHDEFFEAVMAVQSAGAVLEALDEDEDDEEFEAAAERLFIAVDWLCRFQVRKMRAH